MKIKNRQRDALRLKSKRSSQCALQAAQCNEAGRDQQTAHGNLHSEQDVTESESRRTQLRSPASQDVIGIGLPDLPNWHASEQQTSAHRNQQCECVQPAIWLHEKL